MSQILNFIWKYLLGPVIADSQGSATATWNGVVAQTGYNPVNTVVWALVALGFAYGFYKMFDYLEIEFDLETVLYTIPFILLGGFLRYLEDTGIIPYPFDIFTITPFIYILIASLYLLSLFLAYRYNKNNLDRYIGIAGTIFLIPVIFLSGYKVLSLGVDYFYLAQSLIISGFLTAIFYLYIREKEFETVTYTLAGFSQFFGGTVSMLGVSQGAQQKQLLAQLSTQIFGAPGILIVKIGVVAAALYILRDMEDPKVEALVVLALIAIGLATGLRVMLRTATGV